MAAILSVSQNRREVCCWSQSITIQQQQTFQPKRRLISECYFRKIHEINGSLVVRKVKKSWDSWQNQENRELVRAFGVEEQYCWGSSSCLLLGLVIKLQKCINFCLKVGHSANSKPSKSTTYRPVKGIKSWHQKFWAQCTLSTSWLRNGNDRSIYGSSRFDIGRFRVEPTNYERRLHLSDTFASRSARARSVRSLRYGLCTS